MQYNPAIHHRRSIRLQNYDYSRGGAYFVTICTHNRDCLFGEIRDGEIRLSAMGQVVHDEWLNTPKVRPNVDLGAWVVMPNHLHGVLVIREAADMEGRGRMQYAPTGSPSQTLGAIVRGFKSAVVRRLKQAGLCDPDMPVWQRNY